MSEFYLLLLLLYTLQASLTTSSTIVPLQIWDTPSTFDVDRLAETDTTLASFSTMVFVMDMQVGAA